MRVRGGGWLAADGRVGVIGNEGGTVTVYVDAIFDYGHKGKWCHMAADGDINELHAFATSLGLKRAWFQNHTLHPHYDLTPSKRLQAIKCGAIEVTSAELVRLTSEYFKKVK